MIYARTQRLIFGERASEPFEILLDRLQSIALRKVTAAPIVGVTSCRSGEGVTTMAMSLAMTAAALMPDRRKPVLLVDANAAAPSLHDRCHLGREVGLSDVLAGKCSLEAALQESGRPDLQVLTCGSFEELNQSDSIVLSVERFWSRARAEFRLVILDLPPVEHSRELLSILARVDQVLLIVESGRLFAETLLQSVRFLEDEHGREPWAVLNKWRDPMSRRLALRLR